MLTLSPPADIAARIHDLSVVSDRTTARRARLLALSPATDVWAGPAAATFTQGRLAAACAELATLATGLRSLAALLAGLPADLLPTVDASSRATAVMRVQVALGVPADGVWGPVTALSVRRFQASSGLPVDGMVDAATALALAAHTAGGAVRLGTPALWSVLAPGPPRQALDGAAAADGTGLLAGRPPLPAAAPPVDVSADGGTADGGTDAPDDPPAPDPAVDPAAQDVPGVTQPTAAAPVPYVGAAQAPVAPVAQPGAVSTDGYDPSDPDSDPGPGDPEPVDPAASVPGAVDPGAVDPGAVDTP